MMPGEQFAQLLGRARSGDSEAFGEIFRAFNPALVSFVSAMSVSDADDVSSETWIAAARNLTTFDGDERAFRAWIFTIGRRKLIDMSRGAARRLVRPFDLSVLDVQSPVRGPEATVLAEMSVRELASHIVANLTAEQAEVVLLGAIGGLRGYEIAEVLGKTPGAVRMLQHKALKRLARTSAPLSAVPD